MDLITYPLNNTEYRAEDAELFHCTRTSGVWAEKSFTCSVSDEDNNITVDKGVAWIQNTEFAGKVVAMKGVTVIDVGVADDLNDRIDVVAIQFDANENETKIVVKHGDPVLTNPQIPEINRSGGLFELYLCSIYRTAGKTAISASDVTDLRLNPDYCGLMADSVTKIDTSMIESQVTELIDFLKSQIDDLSLTAENVTYDNSESKIEAENLQDAVDHIIQSVIDAKKVATNYLSVNNSGSLEVGIINGNSWKGYRAQIASNAVRIFDNKSSEVASFGSDVIKLTAPQIDVGGKVRGQAGSGMWYKARDISLIASTNSATEGAYFPIIDIKSKNGDWAVGALGDALYFSYTSDEDYNAGNNINKSIALLNSGKLALYSGLQMANSTWLTVVNASGVERQCITLNPSNQYFFGYSGLVNSEGASFYDGNEITIRSNKSITFSAYNGKGYGQIILGAQSTSTGLEFKPATNATCALGVDGRRWKYLYLQNAPNVSSDRRLKKDISYSITNGEMLFDLLKPAVYRYSNDDAEKWHFGFIAQDAVEALEACGYDADDMSLVSKGEYLGMIYQELDALIVYKIQRLESRIAELEKTIA